MPFFLGSLQQAPQKEREESNKRIYCRSMGREGAVFPFKNDICQKSHWGRCISFVLHRKICTVISLILLCEAVGIMKKWLPVWNQQTWLAGQISMLHRKRTFKMAQMFHCHEWNT